MSNLFRNEYGQAYLTVQDDSNQSGSKRIIVDKWRNSTGQRWRFVRSSMRLRNDNDKCLMAHSRETPELYQHDCYIGYSPGQTWVRHGLHIVNGFFLCLTLQDSIKDSNITYAIQARCDSTPPFLWYTWAVDCEDIIVGNHHLMNKTNLYLRNEFSRRFLSVDKEKEKAKHEPWSTVINLDKIGISSTTN